MSLDLICEFVILTGRNAILCLYRIEEVVSSEVLGQQVPSELCVGHLWPSLRSLINLAQALVLFAFVLFDQAQLLNQSFGV